VERTRSETHPLPSPRRALRKCSGDDPSFPGVCMCDENHLHAALGPYGLAGGDEGVREFAGLALTALEHSPGGVMAFEPLRDAEGVIQDFRFVYVNRKGCETVGLSVSWLVGRTLLEVMPGNLEEGLFHKYVTVVETGVELDHEHYYDHDGVERMWFHTIAVRGGPGLVVTFYDITSRKLAERAVQQRKEIEEQLRARSRELEAFFDIAPDLLCITDRSGRLVRVSPSFAELTGHSLDDLVGRSYPDLVPEHERAETMAAVTAVAGGVSLRGSIGRIRCSDGSTRILEWNAIPSDGHLFAVARDITQRILQERRNRREEQQLRHLTEHIPGAVYQLHLDANGRLSFPYVSSGFESIFGVSAREVQQGAEAAFATLHPDDLDHVRTSVETSARTMEDWEEEFRRFAPDGSIRWIRGHSTPRRSEDGSITWHGFVSDVTERRRAEALLAESEERFRGLFELSPLGISLNDLETGRFLETNPAFQEATGFDGDELRGLGYSDLTPAEYDEGDREQIEIVRRLGEYGPYEKSYTRKDGTTSVALFSGRLLTGSDGRRLLWSIVQDISERKHEEQARLDLQRRLLDNQRVESLGVMAGGMAHEFNNLLTVILGNLELMGLERQDGESRALIDEAVLSGRRAAGLVSQLLTLSGRGRTPVATVHLNDVVEDWFQNRELPGGGDGLLLELGEEVPEVQGDPTAMRWILDALVSNSLEALDGQRGSVEVRTGGGALGELLPSPHLERRGYLDPGDYAWIEVQDEGPGMDAETRRRLFDPFFTTRFPGRGLGLPGVLGVVRLVNGGVELESAPGRGTRVRVYIPARPSGLSRS